MLDARPDRSVAARDAIVRLLSAIEARDLRAIERALAEDASWQNVPHDVCEGRDAVVRLLAPVLGWSDSVRWEIVSDAYSDGAGWIERIDRFVIGGVEYAVNCNGVFTVDTEGAVVTSVRDYVDLAEWRERLGPATEAMSTRPSAVVVARHLDAVLRKDVIAMAADYDLDAVLTRNSDRFQGWHEIVGYFDTVPERLRGRELTFGEPTPDGDRVDVSWRIDDDTADAVTGIDRYRVRDGLIVEQVVMLDGRDF